MTPGLVDVRTVVGLAGIYNASGQAHDQDQLERSKPIQPGLRAVDAYNAREDLVAYVRSYGVTTIHTGHGPGALISGQTMIAKTHMRTADKDVIVPTFGVAATLATSAQRGSSRSRGSAFSPEAGASAAWARLGDSGPSIDAGVCGPKLIGSAPGSVTTTSSGSSSPSRGLT